MDSQPLKLPGKKILFKQAEGKPGYEATFELKNGSEMEVAYKIKMRSATKYHITPYIEKIKPGESRIVKFFVSEAPHEKDTFLIESVLVTDSTPVANLFPKGRADIFKAICKPALEESMDTPVPQENVSISEFESIVLENDSEATPAPKTPETNEKQPQEDNTHEDKPAENVTATATTTTTTTTITAEPEIAKEEEEEEEEEEKKAPAVTEAKEDTNEKPTPSEAKPAECAEEPKETPKDSQKKEGQSTGAKTEQKTGGSNNGNLNENVYYIIAGLFALLGVFLVLFGNK